MKLTALALALWITVTIAGIAATVGYELRVPQCQEDVVLIGQGDFEHGRWTQYTCGPAVDDYTGGD